MAVAEIIMNTEVAAAKAGAALGIFGIAQSTLIRAMGYAKAGMVAGLTVGQAVKGMADGGPVEGYSPTPTADNIPAMLTADEFVQPVRATKYYGMGAMEAIRTLSIPREVLSGYSKSSHRKGETFFAEGGAPSTGSLEGKSSSNDEKPVIVNILDPNLFDQYVSSQAGKKTLINFMSKNKRVLGQ